MLMKFLFVCLLLNIFAEMCEYENKIFAIIFGSCLLFLALLHC